MTRTNIHGNIYTDGGDFIGRDKVIYNDVRPKTIHSAAVDASLAKLATMPLDTIPKPTAPSVGSRMPFSYNPLFVGREAELKTLATHLKGGATVAVGQIAAATGMGGIGKTQLVATFVHHYGQYFAGGVYWLNFDNAANIPMEIAQCGATMMELRLDFTNLTLADQVRQVLAAWQSALPRLLVFDNCEDPALLAQWRPPTGNCRVLITSRRQQWDAGLGVRSVTMATLPRLESIALLRKFPPALNMSPFTQEDEIQLDAIAAQLGDLPLALHLAGSYLATYRHAVTPATYIEQLANPNLLTHLSLQEGDLSPTDHEQHVARTFALSYNQLAADNAVDALALNLLQHAACFAPGEPIPHALLIKTLTLEDETPDAIFIEKALRRLLNVGLIERDQTGRILLHRLISHFVWTADVDARQTAQTVVEIKILAEADRINQAGIPGPLQSWQVHLHTITERASQRIDERAADLCNAFGVYLSKVGSYELAVSFAKMATTIYQRVFGEEHSNTALSLNNLGGSLQSIGNYDEAYACIEQALAIRQKLLGDLHSDTATSLNNLGCLLQSKGNYAEARSYFEQALAIRQKVLGEEHPNTALSFNNLGALLQSLRDYTSARLYFEQALAIRQKIWGETHPDTAQSFTNLGGLLSAVGDYAEAHTYLQQALAINQQIMGEEHPDTAQSFNNMGYLFNFLGNYKEAQLHHERALAIRQKVLGEEHPSTAQSLNNLGTLLLTMNDYARAQPYLEQALLIRQKIHGEEHLETATSLNNLGRLLDDIGEYTKARPHLEQALKIRRKILGEEHPNTAQSLDNLGTLLHHTKDYTGAFNYYKQALISRQKVLGMEHLDTAQSYNNLGALLSAAKDYEKAHICYEKALSIRQKILGEEHPETATSLNNLGYLLLAMGDYIGAKSYFQRALDIRQKVLGMEHPNTALSLNNLGYLQQTIGDLGGAYYYYEQALAIIVVKLGPSHPHTVTVRKNLEKLKSMLTILKTKNRTDNI